MKYKIKDNHLLIYNDENELIEDATENMNECRYCKYEPETCNATSPDKNIRKYGGQFCDSMTCIYPEMEMKE